MPDKDPIVNLQIASLVKALPEIYQPIYGHPEHSTRVSRTCEDRLTSIIEIYRALEKKLGHPLRILDLGCAQGFFSLHLANLGANVTGIDFQPQNIAMCQALAAEHSEFKIEFKAARIENVIADLAEDEYDLVLGLSVFHHIIHQLGIPIVQSMFTALGAKTTACIFEIALNNEPPNWAKSQPNHPLVLLIGFAFIHELTQHQTHLSEIARPFYIASNRCWYIDGEVEFFDTWKIESHVHAKQAHAGTRRYFFSQGKIAKTFNLEVPARSPANIKEHLREVALLLSPPQGLKTPRLYAHGRHGHEAWLVRDQLPGELLIDLILNKIPYDAGSVILDVVGQLAVLEANGLYHDDVRTWNTLIDPQGHATLIDYGAISNQPNDCAVPQNRFLAFIIYMQEVLGGFTARPNPQLSHLLNPESLPAFYRSVIWEFYRQPLESWSFAFLRTQLQNSGDDSIKTGKIDDAENSGLALVLDAIHKAGSATFNPTQTSNTAAPKPVATLKYPATQSDSMPTQQSQSSSKLELSQFWSHAKS